MIASCGDQTSSGRHLTTKWKPANDVQIGHVGVLGSACSICETAWLIVWVFGNFKSVRAIGEEGGREGECSIGGEC